MKNNVINKDYKYIIEINVNIHDLHHVKLKDERKEWIFKRMNYQVIKVIAYNWSFLSENVIKF